MTAALSGLRSVFGENSFYWVAVLYDVYILQGGMMRLLPLLLFIPIFSFALKPSVGHKTFYKTSYLDTNTSTQTFWSKQILDIKNKHDDKYHIQWNSDGEYLNDTWNDDFKSGYIQDIRSFCNSKNMKIVNLKTPAGDFTACKIQHTDKKISWYSDQIPFGLLKTVTIDNDGNQTITEAITINK